MLTIYSEKNLCLVNLITVLAKGTAFVMFIRWGFGVLRTQIRVS